MPRTSEIKNVVQKAIKKGGKTSKVLTSKVKTQVKAMLKKSAPSHVRKDVNVHVRRMTDRMDVDVVLHQAQGKDVKMPCPALGSHNWPRLPPVSVLLQDHEGDIRMKNPELSKQELVVEVKNIAEDIEDIDLNGTLSSPMQVDPVPAAQVYVNTQPPCVPLLPPGLSTQYVPQSPRDVVMDSPGLGYSSCPQPLVDGLTALSTCPPVSLPAPLVFDIEMLDVPAPPDFREKRRLKALGTGGRVSQARPDNRFKPFVVPRSRGISGVRTSSKKDRRKDDIWSWFEVKTEVTGACSAPVHPPAPQVEAESVAAACTAAIVHSMVLEYAKAEPTSAPCIPTQELAAVSSNATEDTDDLEDYEDDDDEPVIVYDAKQGSAVDGVSDPSAEEGEGPASPKLPGDDEVEAFFVTVKEDIDDWRNLLSDIASPLDGLFEDDEDDEEDY